MKRVAIITTMMLSMNAFAAPSCANSAMGLDALVTCVAQNTECSAGTKCSSGKEFWDKYMTQISDGFCANPINGASTDAQKEMYSLACSSENGAYFDYDKFVAADNNLKTKLGNDYNFLRTGSGVTKLKELANMLATAAQETTGNGANPAIAPYTADGLYFRYENGSLAANTCKNSSGDCAKLALKDYQTVYYDKYIADTIVGGVNSAFGFMITDNNDTNKVYTGLITDNDMKYNTATNTITWGGCPTAMGTNVGGACTYSPPSVPGITTSTWTDIRYLNWSGFWVGMGNLQLTGTSMNRFFGWYHQKVIDNAPVQVASLQNFITQYLQDGKLAWVGGLWYWNYRINGQGKPNIHSVVTKGDAMCQDIGIVTIMVNGGCNDYDKRVEYYNYFQEKLGLSLAERAGATNASGVNSMQCNQALANYCGIPMQ